MVFTIICGAVITTYFFLINSFRKGWERMPIFLPSKSQSVYPTVAVIVPFHNEKAQLSDLFETLKTESFTNFQLICVDDHSTDGSAEFAESFTTQFPFLQVIRSERFGKKYALQKAIYSTDAELIVTLDADCKPSPKWLETVVKFYSVHHSDLIICPVKMESNNTILGNFQQLEFMSLVASGAGAAGAGFPILCNGANLAFKRSEWLLSECDLCFDEPSGDDIYLLQSVKKRGGKIDFLKSEQAICTTTAKETLSQFLAQRVRWGGKMRGISDWQYVAVGIVVALCSLSVAAFAVLSFGTMHYFFAFLLFFVVKLLADISLLRSVQHFFKIENLIIKTIFFSFFYPFYISYSVIKIVFPHRRTWK